jgi:hypothetical protein
MAQVREADVDPVIIASKLKCHFWDVLFCDKALR